MHMKTDILLLIEFEASRHRMKKCFSQLNMAEDYQNVEINTVKLFESCNNRQLIHAQYAADPDLSYPI